ncbi:MAG: Bax inhibitor-1/YccA family protein [Cystobacterineae bacterium]|nr:Bax inhibitor-1/YccA family protein [Cystobacterineae bacterium]
MSVGPHNPHEVSSFTHLAAEREAAGLFMAKVYRWMTLGLGTTAAVAWFTVHNEALLGFVLQHFLLVVLSPLVLVIALSFMAHKLSGPAAAALFLVYSCVMGLSLSTVFLIYELGTLFGAFAITAGAFLALSIYGTLTRRDLSAWKSFLFIGLFGVIAALVVNLFMKSNFMGFVISCCMVVVFAGLTAYDTQKLREIHASHNHRSTTSLAVHGALRLYLDFINLFLAILRIFGGSRN